MSHYSDNTSVVTTTISKTPFLIEDILFQNSNNIKSNKKFFSGSDNNVDKNIERKDLKQRNEEDYGKVSQNDR